MLWKYDCKYGVDENKIKRASHPERPKKHIDTTMALAFHPGNYLDEYNLKQLKKPASAAVWEAKLRKYGPIIVAGHIGAVRMIPAHGAGHFIVVVGVKDDAIEFVDPLRPHHAFGGEPVSMTCKDFNALAYDDIYAVRHRPKAIEMETYFEYS